MRQMRINRICHSERSKWLLPGRSGFSPNFRQGDAVGVLYERNTDTDNVTNKMVFKGNIERISDNEVCIRLRATQQNAGVLPAASLYAIEHDYMDTSFRSMYLGLPLSFLPLKDGVICCWGTAPSRVRCFFGYWYCDRSG